MQAAEAVGGTGSGAGPLSTREVAALLAPLAGAKRVALAVSGGADSLALLDCLDRWRREPGRPDVMVLTVDHRLRPDSGVAAATVKAIAEERGIPAYILVREGLAPASGVEAAARSARYRLLIAACREFGFSHLVVAHHRDDVAETFLMRLKRGSGVFGLAAMRPVIPVGEVVLVRPFLSVPRARLHATTAAAGLTPIDDPMNRDPRFARTGVRRLLAGGELDAGMLAALAGRFADLADAIDARADAVIARSVATDVFGVAWLDARAFVAAAEDLRARVLVRLLMAIGGVGYPSRSPRLDALSAAIVGAGDGRFKRTLAGTVIERRGGRFAFYRETGRLDLPVVPVSPGAACVWDHRFAVTVGEGAPSGLTVGPLGEAGRRSVGATVREGVERLPPAGALAAMPAVRLGPEIVAAPVFRDTPTAVQVSFRSMLADRVGTARLFPDF